MQTVTNTIKKINRMPNLRMNNTERETPVDRVVRGGLSEEASFTLRPAVRSAGEAFQGEETVSFWDREEPDVF